MRIPRIYYPGALAVGNSVTLDITTSHRLLTVLRLPRGAAVHLFNGQGGEFSGELVTIQRNQATIQLQQFLTLCNESPLTIHLAQGLARGEKMDFIVQKAVELGVTHITPLFTEHSNVRLPAERLAKRQRHWQTVAIQACEQAGRQQVPSIMTPLALADWLPTCQTGLCFVLAPTASQAWPSVADIPVTITLLVGPEGGLSTAEIQLAQHSGFQPLRLGPRILRTETAALVAISCLQARWGDLQ